MKQFALTGVGGYIAPRHMKAIKETGNVMVAALDPNQSVGIIDSFFPDAHFFTEFERFDRHIDKRRRQGSKVDYISICSPNYLHDAHIRFALRSDADAICEKPLVLNPWNVDALEEFERDSGRRIYNIVQLRHLPTIMALRDRVAATPNKIFDIDLSYLTSRGNWYYVSWKGQVERSGGIATNIGVHFFDMLSWIFGERRSSVVHAQRADAAAGYMEFERARVRWFLSINADHLPEAAKSQGKRTYRSILIDGEELEFSDGFTDLHTVTYREILEGRGYGLADARGSIETVHLIREASPIGLVGDYHPLCLRLSE